MNTGIDKMICGLNDRLYTVLEKIDLNGKGVIFVVDGHGRIAGVLTDGDIRRAILAKCSLGTIAKDLVDKESHIFEDMLNLYQSQDIKRKKIQRPYVVAKVGTPTDELLKMVDERVTIVPLVDNEGVVVDYFEYSRASHIPISAPTLMGNELSYVTECIETNWISSQGCFVTEFGESLAAYCNQKYGIPTTSGTTALHLALAALEIGPGDEVICPDLTFIAPANMIKLCGAIPVLVDCELDSWNCDPDQISKNISERTKAIIVVHAFGHAAKMDEIINIAKDNNLYIIEDVAEALGASYKGRILGNMGHMACYSFYGNKIISTGEGGMVLTSDENLKTRLEELRDHGMSKEKRYVHTRLGFNYRMTNLQAAIGLAQFEQLQNILKIRTEQEMLYEKLLYAPELLSFRPKQPWCQTVHWMMTISLKKEGLRDELITFLQARGIDSRQMIFPIHFAKHYQERYKRFFFPNSEKISLNSLHLPSSTDLKPEQIEEVAKAVLGWLSKHRR